MGLIINCCSADDVQVVHGLKQKILKLEGQLRDKEAAHRFVVYAVK